MSPWSWLSSWWSVEKKVDIPVPSVVEGLGVDPAYIEFARHLLAPICAEGCFDKYLNLEFNDAECVKHTLSKVLGIAIILGALLVKVPQILKILKDRSAAGIDLLSVILELFAITSNLAYSYVNGFPFSAWGEACFLAAQTAVVALLVLLYSYKSVLLGIGFFVGYGAILAVLVSGLTSTDMLWSMQAANVPIVLISKLMQAYCNFRNQSTGQMSAITSFLLLAGSAARIFTSIQETGDRVIIITYIAATSVNALIAFQILWYWNSKGLRGRSRRKLKSKTKMNKSMGQLKQNDDKDKDKKAKARDERKLSKRSKSYNETEPSSELRNR